MTKKKNYRRIIVPIVGITITVIVVIAVLLSIKTGKDLIENVVEDSNSSYLNDIANSKNKNKNQIDDGDSSLKIGNNNENIEKNINSFLTEKIKIPENNSDNSIINEENIRNDIIATNLNEKINGVDNLSTTKIQSSLLNNVFVSDNAAVTSDNKLSTSFNQDIITTNNNNNNNSNNSNSSCQCQNNENKTTTIPKNKCNTELPGKIIFQINEEENIELNINSKSLIESVIVIKTTYGTFKTKITRDPDCIPSQKQEVIQMRTQTRCKNTNF